MIDNEALIKHYNEMYAGNKPKFDPAYDERNTIFNMVQWEGLEVLEIGCGEGELAAFIAMSGARLVQAIDKSKPAIVKAQNSWKRDNLEYEFFGYEEIKGKYDIVVMQGVLEHLDDPWTELKSIADNLVADKGMIITSSPCFLNPRGHIWMALAMLFDIPMSLTDLHFFHPWQFTEFARLNNMAVEWHHADLDLAFGERLITDFEKRLPAALGDAGMDTTKVTNLMLWLKKYTEWNPEMDIWGANMVYKLTKRG